MTDGAAALKKIVTNAGCSVPITGSEVQRVSELLDTVNESLVKAHIANTFTNPEDTAGGPCSAVGQGRPVPAAPTGGAADAVRQRAGFRRALQRGKMTSDHAVEEVCA